jgi:hypothetical protein
LREATIFAAVAAATPDRTSRNGVHRQAAGERRCLRAWACRMVTRWNAAR